MKEVLGYLAVDHFLALEKEGHEFVEVYFNGQKYGCRLRSLRLECFSRSMKCSFCGIEGNIFGIEKQPADKRPHLNLYHDCACHVGDKCHESGLILMTHDHIIPVSKGGQQTIDNVQTLCEHCNRKKNDTVICESALGNFREFIADMIARGVSDNEIFNMITCGNLQGRIGWKPKGSDLVTLIRMFLSEVPGKASVCTECTYVHRENMIKTLYSSDVTDEEREAAWAGVRKIDRGG